MDDKPVIAMHLGLILGRLLTLEQALLDTGVLAYDELLEAERAAVDDPVKVSALMTVSRSESEAREYLSQRLNLLEPDVLTRRARKADA
jgi:hypothetical protein